MIKNYYKSICEEKEVRQNLISLRQELRTEENKRAFAYLLGGDFHVLTELLNSEDPKIRKNAALILGDMETEDVLPFLFAAYQREMTLFVRTAYLKAMDKLDYRSYLEKMKTRLAMLRGLELSDENRKHIREEMVQLQEMILRYEKPKKHRYIGFDPAPEVILMTNRCQKSAVKQQITAGQVTELGQGLRVRNGDLKELMKIRTFSELLFPIPGCGSLVGKAEEIGRELEKAGITEFLTELHHGEECFYYRVEIKGPMPLEKRGPFIRKLSEALDRESGGRLRNSAADYEVELRLLERRDGSFLPMLKLFTLPDRRFAYRREVVASSISPVNAALTAQLARPYLKAGAQVLDPFCGVGTMLLERNHLVPADPMYGVDIFGEAIEKARNNTKLDGSIVHYINRDFLDFTHEYLFDEIITDMPRETAEGGIAELKTLYCRFFSLAPEFLKDEGIMILYTMNPELVELNIQKHNCYEIRERFLINEKNRTEVFVIAVSR